MFGDLYASILTELSQALESDMRYEPDENNSCLIVFPNGASVQLEPDSQQQHLLILSELGPLAQGSYREEVLYEALRANDQAYPRYGNFGYLPSRSLLVLWESMPLKNLRGQDVARHLVPFTAKAAECQQAIEANILPVISIPNQRGSSPMNLFGIR